MIVDRNWKTVAFCKAQARKSIINIGGKLQLGLV